MAGEMLSDKEKKNTKRTSLNPVLSRVSSCLSQLLQQNVDVNYANL